MKPHPAGQRYERLAERYLGRRGLRTLARNFHCRLGEIDLVMRDGPVTVFVEVRYRSSSAYGGSLASLTWAKRRRMERAAGLFLGRRPRLAEGPCRFDVVTIEGRPPARQLRWITNAFEAGE
jgi:putative endonuclease